MSKVKIENNSGGIRAFNGVKDTVILKLGANEVDRKDFDKISKSPVFKRYRHSELFIITEPVGPKPFKAPEKKVEKKQFENKDK